MAWITLIIAGCFECMGVIGMNQVKKENTFRSYTTLTIGFSLSFVFLAISMANISMGTAYAVWTGIGTVGGTIVGMVFFGESKNTRRIFFIALVVISVIGLKLIS